MIWPFWGNFCNIFQIAKYLLSGFGEINKHKRTEVMGMWCTIRISCLIMDACKIIN
jgi:hypothetical protein